jgi:alpha 1,6-mannosyltransferase
LSAYRREANHTFEAALDAQLQTLEKTIRSTLPANEENHLLANLTIHQITTASVAAQMSAWVDQWRTNNPGWTYNLLTTHPTSLLSLFSSIPSIVSAYEAYPSLRHDLTRSLTLWYYGGFYTDVDTWERVSLRDCWPIVDVMQGGKGVSLMVGVERDEPFYSQLAIEERGWSRGFGFGLGTVWAPRRLDPILRKVVVRSISHAEVQRKLSDGRGWRGMFQADWEECERSEISGEGMFTDAVLEALSEGLKEDHELRDRDAGLEKRVSWKKFKGLQNTLWIEANEAKDGQDMQGIAVLPINVWSNGQNHSGSGSFEAEDACVNRVFGWKPKKEWYEKFFWR